MLKIKIKTKQNIIFSISEIQLKDLLSKYNLKILNNLKDSSEKKD